MASDKHHTDGRRKSHGRRSKHNNYKQRQSRPLPRVSYENLLQRFTACVNCGYFITSYRAHYGNDVLKQALSQSNERRDGWLHLPWDIVTRQLVHRFFGVRSDVGPVHLEFMCTTCQRKFLYTEEEVEVPVATAVVPSVDEADAVRDTAVEESAVEEGTVEEGIVTKPDEEGVVDGNEMHEAQAEGVDLVAVKIEHGDEVVSEAGAGVTVETVLETRVLFQVELKIR